MIAAERRAGRRRPAALCQQVVERMRPAEGELDDEVTALLVKLV